MNIKIKDHSEVVANASKAIAARHVQRICEIMRTKAKADSPYRTGNNRDSIDMQVNGQEGMVYTESGYGGYLEIGTSQMPARPYIRPAFDYAKKVLESEERRK